MKLISILATAAALLAAMATPVRAAIVINQTQADRSSHMANFSQSNLAQSFQQSTNNIAGAGIYLQAGAGSGFGNFTISLWSGLPNAGGVFITSGTTATESNGHWLDVFWDPVAIAPATTQYLVFTSTNNSYGISGSIGNPYLSGQVYANGGFGSFPSYDYTFRTYSDDGFAAAIPEPSTWAMLILGFAGVGFMTYRRNARPASKAA